MLAKDDYAKPLNMIRGEQLLKFVILTICLEGIYEITYYWFLAVCYLYGSSTNFFNLD